MDGSKKIIKADNLEKMGLKVENVDLGGKRTFTSKVFKDTPVDEHPVEMEEAAPAELEAVEPDVGEEEQVKLERFHDEEGALIGLRITCKCGEVIDLEFSRD